MTGAGGEAKAAKRQKTATTSVAVTAAAAAAAAQPQRLHRRLDIKVVLPEHFPFALLYFGSSEHFNRSMRRVAKDQYNWCLNQEGCYRLPKTAASQIRGYADGGGEGGLPFREEADIFKLLRLPYVAPADRNV